MSELKTVIEMILEDGPPALPDGLEPAIKFTLPDGTTCGGFDWFRRGWVSDDKPFNPVTCESGGLHVANTIFAAQSGGGRYTNCLWVGVDPTEAGPWEMGKRKAPRVFVAGPVDLIGVIRHRGARADLSGANLSGADLSEANLQGANLSRANLRGADLSGADLSEADLQGANLRGAHLSRADLWRADLSGADLQGANLQGADLQGADLRDADLSGANLRDADLSDAYGRDDWGELVARGAIR